MKKSSLALAFVLASILAAPAFAAETVPCEKMLEDLRAAVKAAQPGDVDTATVTALQDKGIERCNADDDAHADEFFTQAMKVMGK